MRLNFRLKVDLSRVFQDVQQFSRIFVDSAKISHINDLMDHIVNLFNIKTPFHLVSTDKGKFIFLPPKEDIRILENDDTVLVVPGKGTDDSQKPKASMNVQKNEVKDINNSYQVKDISIDEETLDNKSQTDSVGDNGMNGAIDDVATESTTPNTTMYHSIISQTFDMLGDDSKMTEDILTEDILTEDSTLDQSSGSVKRKRPKRRRSKKVSTLSESQNSEYKRPRILSSCSLPKAKHIRFDVSENKSPENNLSLNEEKFSTSCMASGQRKSGNNCLAELLSLRQSSTPLTFIHKAAMKVPKLDEQVPEKKEMEDSSAKIIVNVNKEIAEKCYEVKNTTLEKEGIENTNKNESNSAVNVELNQVYSFKVYKISENYTPQVSDVILGRSLSHNKVDSTYTFEILVGKEQLEAPIGKFSLPEDENEDNEYSDTITLNESQLLELKKLF